LRIVSTAQRTSNEIALAACSARCRKLVHRDVHMMRAAEVAVGYLGLDRLEEVAGDAEAGVRSVVALGEAHCSAVRATCAVQQRGDESEHAGRK
jgi:hypothetical protein